METNRVREMREYFNSEEEEEQEEEEEEALSLCDLPDNLNKQEDDEAKRKPDSHDEEFDFLLWDGSFSEMCVADEVFFQGQILPLRPAGSAPTGFKFNRSGSMGSELSRSYSSRSSSIGSQNSSISNSSSSSSSASISKPRIMRNHQFHTHPSPKPQIIKAASSTSNSRQVSFFSSNSNRKSISAWEFFRLGVAPAPEITGLQDLKVRCAKKSSSNNNSDKSNHSLKQLVGKGSGFFSGCKCSITVPSDIIIMKKTESGSTKHAMKEKVVLEIKKQKQGKKVMSRRRTFEWIKELSNTHAISYGYPNDEEALLANSSITE
ncbi:putative membrane-associated kinase regulator 1 [Senna tora]|uniref:Putative membrane-associated kinase regulator 1 n=1 Tax=Senna tora TaxID=362788 RepID=A0A834W690_9FABA|nr:putative membrane-associated kinase regulator 1 [Senna tora]